ncbi:MAG: nodulation protein NodH [Maritimibacter sp.]
MTTKFESFVILAEMRTGSNFLESNLNEFDGITCYGEAFNPYLLVDPERKELFGMTMADRDAHPMRLVEKMKENTEGIPGFRLFHDHDPRVFEAALSDPTCAKIVLTRNMVESWVSQRIAWSTKQWQLNDLKDAKKWRVKFDPKDFKHFYFSVKERQLNIARRLQSSGQTAFYIDYEDIQDVKVVNGLAKYLGVDQTLDALSGKFKKQNPEEISEKVRNFELLEQTVNEIDRYDLGTLPNFEPKRAAMIPTYVMAAKAPLLFLPIPGAPDEEIRAWMAAVDDVALDRLISGFTQKDLRKWKRSNPGHRSFTVLRHPAARAHSVFSKYVLNETPYTMWELRRTLIKNYDLDIPWDTPIEGDYDSVRHRHAFLAFLKFVAGNLNGQTSHPVHPVIASQGHMLGGFSGFVSPDHIIREDSLATGIAQVSMDIGLEPPELPDIEVDTPYQLGDIHDDEIEKAVRNAYQRDYMLFGFDDWKKP